jgi:two-component system, NtrC family, sensor histidine kinase PilS
LSILRRTADALLPPVPGTGPEFRRRVEWLMLLRLVVTTLLLGATLFFQLQQTGVGYVESAVPLYILIAATFTLSLIYALALPRIPHLWQFSFFQSMVDVVYATVVIYFTGGPTSVFTLLYIFPIITSGLLHFRRGALIAAAGSAVLFGTLINLQFYGVLPPSDWPWVSPWSSYTAGYLLWVLVIHFTIFLFVALLASSVAEQARTARISLNLKEIDYKKLAALHTSIVRSIPIGIITTDEHDDITFVNTAGAKQIGVAAGELVRSPVRQIFTVIEDTIDKTASRGESYRTILKVDGRPRHFELSVSDLKSEDEVPRGRLVVFQDVTMVRTMEERVRLSEKQAAFVRIAAGMAHEIRNPLASIRGATEMLSNSSGGSASDKKLMNIVIRETDRLNSLLSDFLLTVGNRQPKKIRVILSDLVEETVGLFAGDASARHNVSVETLINKGVEVEGEPARLRQALWNLLTNAVDATPEGGIIRVLLGTEEESGYAVVKVQDSGPGIPQEIRERLFEPFTTTKEKGTGLGLSLVLSVVESHNGTIEVHSTPRTGTVFTVRLPPAPSADKMGERGPVDV